MNNLLSNIKFGENHFLQTFVFGSIGSFLYLCFWNCYQWGVKNVYATFRCEVSLNNHDENYSMITNYIFEQYISKQRNAKANMLAYTMKKKHNYKEQRLIDNNILQNIPIVKLRPNESIAVFFFTYKNKTITFYRKKDATIHYPNNIIGQWEHQKGFQFEEITLSTWGKNTEILQSLFEEAIQHEHEKIKPVGTPILLLNTGCYPISWCEEVLKAPKLLDTVILDEEKKTFIYEDIQTFYNNRQWYQNVSIPYRRGYLLYGPPGCGKTSLIEALASEFRKPICILNLTTDNIDDNNFAKILRETPPESFIILEDIDALYNKRKKTTSKLKISFSALLNGLDGILAFENRILFLTSNYIDQLDSALIRPGRCDVKMEITLATKHQIEHMFLRFFPTETENAKAFTKLVPANTYSMVQLQCYLLRYVDSVAACFSNLAMLETITEDFTFNKKKNKEENKEKDKEEEEEDKEEEEEEEEETETNEAKPKNKGVNFYRNMNFI